jgi:SET domain
MLPSDITLHPSLEVRRNTTSGDGVFSNANISKGEILIRIPHHHFFTEEFVEGTEHGKVIREVFPDVETRVIFWVVMVAERFLLNVENPSRKRIKLENRFTEYLRSVPSHYDDISQWSKSEINYVRSTNLYESAVERREFLYDQYHRLFPALSESHPSLFPEEVFTFERFLWAYSTFISRGFSHILSVSSTATSINEDAIGCLCAGLDLFNHNPNAKVVWLRDETSFCFVLDQDISAGSEVFISYGPKSNEELIFGYGFMIPGNIADSTALKLSIPSESMAHQLISALNFNLRVNIRLSDFSNNTILESHLLLQLMRVCSLQARDARVLVKGLRSATTSSLENECLQEYKQAFSKPVSFSSEYASIQLLYQLLRKKISDLQRNYPWLVDESAMSETLGAIATSSTDSEAYRQRISRLYIQGQVGILEGCFCALQQYQATICAHEMSLKDPLSFSVLNDWTKLERENVFPSSVEMLDGLCLMTSPHSTLVQLCTGIYIVPSGSHLLSIPIDACLSVTDFITMIADSFKGSEEIMSVLNYVKENVSSTEAANIVQMMFLLTASSMIEFSAVKEKYNLFIPWIKSAANEVEEEDDNEIFEFLERLFLDLDESNSVDSDDEDDYKYDVDFDRSNPGLNDVWNGVVGEVLYDYYDIITSAMKDTMFAQSVFSKRLFVRLYCLLKLNLVKFKEDTYYLPFKYPLATILPSQFKSIEVSNSNNHVTEIANNDSNVNTYWSSNDSSSSIILKNLYEIKQTRVSLPTSFSQQVVDNGDRTLKTSTVHDEERFVFPSFFRKLQLLQRMCVAGKFLE